MEQQATDVERRATNMDRKSDMDEEIMEKMNYITAKCKGNKMTVDRRPLGEYIFSQANSPLIFLIQLLETVPKFLDDIGEKDWKVDKSTDKNSKVVDKSVGFQQLIIEAFYFWFDPKQEKVGHESGEKNKVDETEGVSEKLADMSLEKLTPNKRLNLSDEDKILLVRKILKLKVVLNPVSNIWPKIVDVLELKHATIMPTFLNTVDIARNRKGTATFELLNMCIKDNLFKYHFQPDVLLQALLLGELGSAAIDQFCLNRSKDFRDACRDVLQKALEIAQIRHDDPAKEEKWANVLKEKFNKKLENVPNFQDFANHVKKLLPELGHKSLSKGRISKNYGRETIRKAVAAFTSKAMNKERYRERIWTVLAQQKDLKTDVLKELDKVTDPSEQAAEKMYWKEIDKFNEKNIPLISESEDDTVTAQENAKFLTLPNNINEKVVFVDTSNKIEHLAETLEEEKSKYSTELVVGIDVEWSAYKSDHKAAIFQLATKEAGVFVIDLDPATDADKSAVMKFLSTFFKDERIMKIGLNFKEDLKKLRATFPSCKPLYTPKMTVNIDMIVDRIRVDENAAKNQMRQKRPKPKSAKNLSELCKDLLEKPLDKAEQESVWDRRPLRKSQLVYAALDAYCLIELYDCCVKWAEKYELVAREIATDCKCERVALPLFVIDT